jgi:SAM-dependent methyltransferase
MSRSFVKEFFDDKSLDGLRKVITGDWSDKNIRRHLDLLNPPAKARKILEIGCGLGRLLIPLYDRGAEHCVGLDASQAMIAEGQKMIGGRNIKLLHCGGDGNTYLPLDGYFDFAFSIITFQHIPDTGTVKQYLREAHRLLRPGGHLSFQVLSHDAKPGRELWTYHDLDALKAHIASLGIIGQWHEGDIWAIFQGQKPRLPGGKSKAKAKSKKPVKKKASPGRPKTG